MKKKYVTRAKVPAFSNIRIWTRRSIRITKLCSRKWPGRPHMISRFNSESCYHNLTLVYIRTRVYISRTHAALKYDEKKKPVLVIKENQIMTSLLHRPGSRSYEKSLFGGVTTGGATEAVA